MSNRLYKKRKRNSSDLSLRLFRVNLVMVHVFRKTVERVKWARSEFKAVVYKIFYTKQYYGDCRLACF